MTTRAASASLVAVLLAGCGTDAGPEIVVRDATGEPVVVSATADSVFWTVQAGGARRVLGGSLVQVPAEASELGSTAGAIVPSGSGVLLATPDGILSAALDSPAAMVMMTTAETLGEAGVTRPTLAWSLGATVTWGKSKDTQTATIPRADRVDRLLVTPDAIYAASSNATSQRLSRIDRTAGTVQAIADARSFSAEFPGGAAEGATYHARLVGADDTAGYWLVEESPSQRAVLVAAPAQGMPAVVLDHISAPSAFFVSDDGFYWQEDDALLTAPRTGGAASIAAHLTGPAGAVTDGFVYYVNGTAIERLAL